MGGQSESLPAAEVFAESASAGRERLSCVWAECRMPKGAPATVGCSQAQLPAALPAQGDRGERRLHCRRTNGRRSTRVEAEAMLPVTVPRAHALAAAHRPNVAYAPSDSGPRLPAKLQPTPPLGTQCTVDEPLIGRVECSPAADSNRGCIACCGGGLEQQLMAERRSRRESAHESECSTTGRRPVRCHQLS